jgi:hypothetical protein
MPGAKREDYKPFSAISLVKYLQKTKKEEELRMGTNEQVCSLLRRRGQEVKQASGRAR